jgi:hypothetical protein
MLSKLSNRFGRGVIKRYSHGSTSSADAHAQVQYLLNLRGIKTDVSAFRPDLTDDFPKFGRLALIRVQRINDHVQIPVSGYLL